MGWDALESPSWHVGDHPVIKMLPLELGWDGMGCSTSLDAIFLCSLDFGI